MGIRFELYLESTCSDIPEKIKQKNHRKQTLVFSPDVLRGELSDGSPFDVDGDVFSRQRRIGVKRTRDRRQLDVRVNLPKVRTLKKEKMVRQDG